MIEHLEVSHIHHIEKKISKQPIYTASSFFFSFIVYYLLPLEGKNASFFYHHLVSSWRTSL